LEQGVDEVAAEEAGAAGYDNLGALYSIFGSIKVNGHNGEEAGERQRRALLGSGSGERCLGAAAESAAGVGGGLRSFVSGHVERGLWLVVCGRKLL